MTATDRLVSPVIALLAAVCVVIGAGLVLVRDPSPISDAQRPLWATALALTVLGTTLLSGGLVGTRGWDALSAYVATVAGTLAGVGLTVIPLPSVIFGAVAGAVLAAVGLWHLRPRALLDDHRPALAATLVAAVAAEAAFGAVSTGVWLLPYLWVSSKLAVFGVLVAATLAGRVARGRSRRRQTAVAFTGIGGVVFALAPLVWGTVGCSLAGCFGLHWSTFEYHAMDLSSMAVSFSADCNTCTATVDRVPVLVGLAAVAAGTVADAVLGVTENAA